MSRAAHHVCLAAFLLWAQGAVGQEKPGASTVEVTQQQAATAVDVKGAEAAAPTAGDDTGLHRVRVRATVAVIDPEAGVADIISQLRSSAEQRGAQRARQAVELRRVPQRAGSTRVGRSGEHQPKRQKTAATAARQEERALHRHGPGSIDAQRSVSAVRERMADAHRKERVQEILNRRQEAMRQREDASWKVDRDHGSDERGHNENRAQEAAR